MDGLIIFMIVFIAILLALAVILTLTFFKRKDQEKFKEPEYKAFFFMGICFLPLGIVFTAAISPAFVGFIGMGICYIAIGLANKDKWINEE
jgi:hypothetical protein